MLFDPATAFLRRICRGDTEVLRGIYAAVRDRNWGTVPPAVTLIESQVADDAFALRFEAECCQDDIHFRWQGELTGAADGTVVFDFDGKALSTFLRNRIGFCVLHPIRECAGARARQTRADGRMVECRFPQAIEPQIFGQSSFQNLRALAHEITPGLWAEVNFEGEVFEMEDQRNWTDASFKTYCTPLALPFPVEIAAGTRVRQRVTLRLAGSSAQDRPPRVEVTATRAATVTLTPPAAPGCPLPRLGLGLASHGQDLTEHELARLRDLSLAHLRVDLKVSDPAWPLVWDRAAREAASLNAALEVAVHWPRAGEGALGELQRRLGASPAPLARVLALREGEAATGAQTLALTRRALAGKPVPVGAGSDANFCELNRERALGRVPAAEADFLFWSINPQVHAFDDASVIETLEAQPATVATARAFGGGRPLVVSPVTLKPRFNAVATGAEPPPPPGQLPRAVDPRQRTMFAAAWTLGTLAALGAAGVESITLYETTGWRGLVETPAGSPLPEQFPARPGEVFPLFHLLAALAGFERMAVLSADPRLAALALFDPVGWRRLVLANLHSEPIEIVWAEAWPHGRIALLRDPDHPHGEASTPDVWVPVANFAAAPPQPVRLVLPAYALARLDLA